MRKLSLMTAINELGYGQVGKHFAKELSKREDVETALWPIGNAQVLPDDLESIKKLINNQDNYDVNAPCLRIYHQFSLAERVGRGNFYAMPIFELNTFNSREKHHLSNTDYLIVNSEWAKQVILNNIPKRASGVYVVPLGFDPEVFYAGRKPSVRIQKRKDSFVFLNCGKWETRKGHDILIKAFTLAFEQKDNVELWMMPTNPFITPEEKTYWEGLYKSCKLWSKVRIIDRLPTQNDVADVMCAADCGVFPARAEGWNLEALEMLALGKHLIITDYSAHKEFANADNSYLIPANETEPAMGIGGMERKWFYGQGEWAKFDNNTLDTLVEYMRLTYKGRDMKQDHSDSVAHLTWENAVNKLLKVVHG
jgi:glycosyltransferase involved in cell wall biosynthesis